MTYEEALKITNELDQHICGATCSCSDIRREEEFVEEDYKALLKEAIKKQIPTTPMDILYQEKFHMEVGICSSCGNIVNSEYEWCDGCGQHLDWSK